MLGYGKDARVPTELGSFRVPAALLSDAVILEDSMGSCTTPQRETLPMKLITFNIRTGGEYVYAQSLSQLCKHFHHISRDELSSVREPQR